MIKHILPESFDFGVPSVEIIGCGRNGLDKQAMCKRASVDPFEDVIADLKPMKKRAYLHVITTGAQETYNANRNGDDFPETYQHVVFPYPEDPRRKSYDTDGGLKKYHNASYMSKKAAVYQEHHTKDTMPSGEIIAARYNDDMHRGELIIAVDTDKWADRLHKKASGQNIYLSMGCVVEKDTCRACGRMAKTAADHCDHFKRMRCQILDDGTQCSVINDAPKFYDISGVDVPADRIAFVLRKVASGDMAKTASYEALETYGARTPMLFTKAASTLRKLSKLEKRVEAFIEGDKDARQAPEFMDDDDTQRIFILKVRNHPCDEIIDSCNRKGMLLSPGMLFKLLGKDMENPEDRENLCSLDDDSCGDCTHMLRELEDDEDRNVELQDGSFDQHFIPDVRLENILEAFMPLLGMTNPAVGARSIRVTIIGSPRGMRQRKTAAAVNPEAQAALRRTYARYFISFAAQNDEATCHNALRKIATYGK